MVGGAVRNALLGMPVGEIDIATTAVPEKSCAACTAAGFKAVPTGIEHGTVTVVIDGAAVRGDDAARRTSRPTAATPRSRSAATGRPTPSGATSPSTRCPRRATARSTIMSAGLPISAARRVRFIGDPQDAHRGRLPAHPALLPLPCRLWRRRTRCRPALHACIAGARRPRAAVARARAHGDDEAAGRAARRRRRLPSMAEAGLLLRVLGGVPLSRELREHGEGRGGDRRCAPTRCAGSARSAVLFPKMPNGCGRNCGSPTPSTSGLRSMAKGWWRDFAASARRPQRRCSIVAGRRISPIACCSPGRAPAHSARCGLARACDLAAALDRAGVSVEGRRFHARGVAKGPALGAALAAAERPGSRQGFRTSSRRLTHR